MVAQIIKREGRRVRGQVGTKSGLEEGSGKVFGEVDRGLEAVDNLFLSEIPTVVRNKVLVGEGV